MQPPLGGRLDAVRRLADEVRRRLEPLERVVPITLPGGPDRASPPADAPNAPTAAPEHDDAARIDAARERLRATIQPRDDRGEEL